MMNQILNWLTDNKIPIGHWAKAAVDWLIDHGGFFFDWLSIVLQVLIDALLWCLQTPHPLVIIVVAVALGWWLKRNLVFPLFVAASLLLIVNQGYWKETTETLSLVIAASLVCMALGVPVGVAAAHRPALFGLHPADPRPDADDSHLRLSDPGADPVRSRHGAGPDRHGDLRHSRAGPPDRTGRQVDAAATDRGGSRPSARRRASLLWKVELPWALPNIMAGLTQTIMLSLSMVVIAALVGAPGLGVPVLRALNSVNIAKGFEAGAMIVIVAILLDRFLRTEGSGENGQ